MIVEIPASICFEPLLIRQANGSQTKECEKRSVPFCFIDAIVSTCFCSLRYVMFLDVLFVRPLLACNSCKVTSRFFNPKNELRLTYAILSCERFQELTQSSASR